MKVQIKDGVSFECDNDFLLQSALEQGLGFPYECASGSCGNCRFELLSGDIDYPNGQPGILSEKDLERNRHLACQCVPKTDLEIKVRLFDQYEPVHNPSRFIGKLVEVEKVTHDISEFRFQTDSEQVFEPGQFALIDVPGVEGARAYSMCNVGGSPGFWDFQIKKVPGGAATSALFSEVKVGLEVAITGPYGRGYFHGFRGRDIVLIAGGSGLSPMVSIARAIDAASSSRSTEKISFFYGGRAAQDIAGEQFLSGMSGYGEWIKYEAALSDVADAGAINVFEGFVHDLAKQRLGEGLREVD
ncbi:MAG: 2Fe-2S iron-sulfur cluster binding domain-containing protein, partial [Gammaproteobacteria bacterium]